MYVERVCSSGQWDCYRGIYIGAGGLGLQPPPPNIQMFSQLPCTHHFSPPLIITHTPVLVGVVLVYMAIKQSVSLLPYTLLLYRSTPASLDQYPRGVREAMALE